MRAPQKRRVGDAAAASRRTVTQRTGAPRHFAPFEPALSKPTRAPALDLPAAKRSSLSAEFVLVVIYFAMLRNHRVIIPVKPSNVFCVIFSQWGKWNRC